MLALSPIPAVSSQSTSSVPRHLVFGPFTFDEASGELRKHGVRVRLEGQPLRILAALIRQPGQVVTREEFQQQLWTGDTFVDFDHGLNAAMNRLRQVLGDSADQPRYIETLPGRGYRFVAPVQATVSKPVLVMAPAPPAVAETELAAPAAAGIALAGHRYRSKWTWGVLATTVVAAIGIYASNRIRDVGQTGHGVDSLVVLPFVNLTANPENEYFSDGLTEEVTNALAHLDGVRVVARTTAFQFKGKAQDVRSIAQQLHVSTVLEGSVRRQDRRLRVTVQLNDARSGYHIWSQTYDRDEGDILHIQEDISNQVARTIRPDSHSARAASGSRDLEAYNLYLLGQFQRRKPDQTSERKALRFFQQAIQKDPQYAAAYAGLAECYMALAQENSLPPLEAWPLAQKAADKALALDDNLAEAHTTQAIVNLLLDRNWEVAERQFRRAIALNENDAAAHHWFSHYFLAMGRFSESLAESRRALELDPLDVQISGHQSFHYLRARDYPNAIKAGLQTLELDPHAELAFIFLTWAYEDTAQWDKAIDASQFANVFHPEASALRAVLRADGVRGYWRARLAFLSQQKTPENYLLAVFHARLGESDQALERLELAFERHEPDLIYIKREPAFDWMAGNPRFRALTDALKLP